MENKRFLNDCDSYEFLTNVKLNPEKFPIAFNNKVDELMKQKAFNTREDAETYVKCTDIELELYYEPSNGIFAVESDAIENGCSVLSPYSGRAYKYPNFQEDEFMTTLYSLVDEEDNTKIPICYVNNTAEEDVPERILMILENKFLNDVISNDSKRKTFENKENMLDEIKKFVNDPYSYNVDIKMNGGTYSLVTDKVFAI